MHSRLLSFSRLLDRWIKALCGPRRHRAVIATLAGYGLVWTLYRIVATRPRDIHFDMSEVYAWSRMLAAGYDKHPPLSAWIVRAWFSVLPVQDWSFTLLATANISVTLYIAWRALERWTDPAKAVVGLALLTLIPFFNFHSLKYNANTVLLPFWAFAAYAFLRAIEDRKAGWGLLAGAAAGAAMLGKYWSIFLIAGLGLAALADSRRAAFFRSPTPWLMIAAGALVLSPHIVWLVTNDFPTFGYASVRSHSSWLLVASAAARYVVGVVGYIAAPLIVWFWLLRPTRQTLRDVIAPADPQRRLMVWSVLAPNLLPVAVALVAGMQLTPLWTLPGFALLPLALLSSPLLAVDRAALRTSLGLALLLSLGALALSPAIALGIHLRNPPRPTDYASLLAKDVALEWAATTGRPLVVIAGEPDLAMAVAYQLRLPSAVFKDVSIEAASGILAKGGAIVCPGDDRSCIETAEKLALPRPAHRRRDLTKARPLFGIPGKPIDYMLMIVPPPD